MGLWKTLKACKSDLFIPIKKHTLNSADKSFGQVFLLPDVTTTFLECFKSDRSIRFNTKLAGESLVEI